MPDVVLLIQHPAAVAVTKGGRVYRTDKGNIRRQLLDRETMPLTGRICTKSVNVHRGHQCTDVRVESGNTRQVNSFGLYPRCRPAVPEPPAGSPRGGHFLQRLPDTQPPDDVVPLAAEHYQGRHAAVVL